MKKVFSLLTKNWARGRKIPKKNYTKINLELDLI